ncbi:MAG TPA: T9SS type A sorting domain-containing protein [Cyclobacteriaceae bacterium]
MRKILNLIFALLVLSHAGAQNILLSDFEQSTYTWLPGGSWTATGTCFGTGPAQGTLSKQNTVKGYLGKGLVNTYLGGNDSTGTLTSPSFIITRKYIRFLIGGGNWRPQTSINLLIDGQVVRMAVGMGDREQLDWLQWNVSGFLNKTAQIQIVDSAGPNTSRGWRHLNVDNIIATDTTMSSVIVPSKKYLLLPVKTGSTSRMVELVQDGLVVREMNVELSTTPDFWVFMDLTQFQGQELVVRLDSKLVTSTDLQNFFVQSDVITTTTPIYNETLRPIYHFSTKRGYLADPNDLIYANGEYHLSYQHNPFGTAWDNMHHGHAVSTDLVHWTELPEALYETYMGEAWNGSSVIDWNNTAGFGARSILTFYTSAAGNSGNPRMSAPNFFAQSLAYSIDSGRTFNYYQGNAVVPNIAGSSNHDPKVFWYAPGNVWVMVFYVDNDGYHIFNSTDLKNWIFISKIDITGTTEVPDLYPLALDGDTTNVKWIFSADYREYIIGTFDGQTFTQQYGPFWFGRQKYDLSAALTFSEIPTTDGRRIMMTNGRTDYPGMPFNRYMNLPNVLTLKTNPDNMPEVYVNPVSEVSKLRIDTTTWNSQTLNKGVNLLNGLSGEGVEMEIVFKPQSNSLLTFSVGEYYITYYTSQKIIGAGEIGGDVQYRSLSPVDGQVHLRVFYDRGSWELYGNEGEFYMPIVITPKAGNWPLSLTTANASVEIVSLNLYHLGSIWGTESGVVTGNFPEQVAKTSYLFYPNPVSGGYFMIDRNAFEEKELIITLFDLTGQEVLKKILPDGENQVDLSGDLPNGVYEVVIKGNNKTCHGRLLIMDK